MCSNSKSLNTNYAVLTANTGIGTVSIANNNLSGNGPRAMVLTSSARGTLIKSIIIKAIQPVTTGMVRLFIANAASSTISLFKEIAIPNMPMLNNVPIPAPIFPMFEMKLEGEFMLNPDYHLYATTQNQETFNIIAEGVDWTYPVGVPTVCCNFMQEQGNTGLGTVNNANVNLDGSGPIVSIFTGVNNGSVIKSITFKAQQSTTEGMLRMFISPDGINWFLMREISVPQTNQSGFEPSFKQILEDGFTLKAGYHIGVSTQIAQSFSVTIEGSTWSYAV